MHLQVIAARQESVTISAYGSIAQSAVSTICCIFRASSVLHLGRASWGRQVTRRGSGLPSPPDRRLVRSRGDVPLLSPPLGTTRFSSCWSVGILGFATSGYSPHRVSVWVCRVRGGLFLKAASTADITRLMRGPTAGRTSCSHLEQGCATSLYSSPSAPS